MEKDPENTKSYKLSLSGEDITVNKDISEEMAHKILLILVPSDTTKFVSSAMADGENVIVGEVSPKEFMVRKRPATDTEKIACLAYYLANYRNTRQFKTEELTDLNREAQQIRFSNPSAAARNAVQPAGYLAPVGGGKKQLTTVGEEIVVALPDREKVRQILDGRRRPRIRKKGEGKSGSVEAI